MKKKITIGMFVDSFFPMIDGVAMVVDNYAKRLSKIANVIVFCPKYPGKKYDDRKYSYKVLRCFSAKLPFIDYSLPTPKLDKSFEKKLSSCKLDIVHIHSPFTLGHLGIEYAKKHNIPVIGTMHSQYKQDFTKAVKNERLATILTNKIIKIYDSCDKCFAVNKKVAEIFYNEYGCQKLPGVINNATEMTLLEDKRFANDYINKLYNIDTADKVFLFVGRINTLKNVFFLVDSLISLKQKNPFNFKMLFVGSGKEEEQLKTYIKEKNMDKEITLCGKIEDREILKYYYQRADLFLFPSLYDTNSLVQIEAASQKTPTLFLNGAATAYTIKDNISGFLSENDPTLYANRIIEIINNQKLYNEVCENAYREVYKTWDSSVDDLIKEYQKILNK